MCERLQITEQELREDVDVLNVVNFGGGSYVLYAEVQGDEIDVDPEPYSDNFARPARLLPLEAKALVAAIDLLGDHLPEGSLASARGRRSSTALGEDPAQEGLQIAHTTDRRLASLARRSTRAIVESRLLSLEYYKENEDEFTKRTIEPYALINGREGWYVFSYDLDKRGHAPLPARPHQAGAESRSKTFEPRPEVDPTRRPRGLAAHGRRARLAGRARLDLARARALGARAARRSSEELADGALIVELPFAGDRVARPRGPARGRRRGRARARGRARTAVLEAARELAGKPPASAARPPEPARNDRAPALNRIGVVASRPRKKSLICRRPRVAGRCSPPRGGLGLWYQLFKRPLPKTSGRLRAARPRRAASRSCATASASPTSARAARPTSCFALGFCHGQDRLWQLEFFRRATAGRLCRVRGRGGAARRPADAHARHAPRGRARGARAVDARLRALLGRLRGRHQRRDRDAPRRCRSSSSSLRLEPEPWTTVDLLAVREADGASGSRPTGRWSCCAPELVARRRRRARGAARAAVPARATRS